MLQLHVDTVQLELDQFMMKGIQENLVFFFFLRAPYQLPLKKKTQTNLGLFGIIIIHQRSLMNDLNPAT